MRGRVMVVKRALKAEWRMFRRNDVLDLSLGRLLPIGSLELQSELEYSWDANHIGNFKMAPEPVSPEETRRRKVCELQRPNP